MFFITEREYLYGTRVSLFRHLLLSICSNANSYSSTVVPRSLPSCNPFSIAHCMAKSDKFSALSLMSSRKIRLAPKHLKRQAPPLVIIASHMNVSSSEQVY